MIAPQKEDIAKFDGYGIDDFERWLRVGLEGLLIDGLGVRNFRPVEYCIWREHSLPADLQIIYEEFPAEQKAFIRSAIARLIDRLPPEQRYVPVFQTLIDLAVLVGAHEIFDVLPARGEGFLTIEREYPELPSLYGHAVDAVAELSDRSPNAEECVRRLIGTPGSFDFDYARTVLVALCKIAPKKFAEHMALLRVPLALNFKSFHPTKHALKHLADDIIKTVGLEIVEQNWTELRISESPEIDEPNDNWFFEAIVSQLSKSRTEAETEVIFMVSNPGVRIQVQRRATGTSRAFLNHDRWEVQHVQALKESQALYYSLATDQVTEEEKAANKQSINTLLQSIPLSGI
jgi:hypothetical protein